MFRNSGKTGPDRDTTQHSRAVSPTGRRPRPSSSAMDRWIHCCSINGSEDAGLAYMWARTAPTDR
jgi:hypothetical protein